MQGMRTMFAKPYCRLQGVAERMIQEAERSVWAKISKLGNPDAIGCEMGEQPRREESTREEVVMR